MDLSVDPVNCGSCGAKCPAGLLCSAGACGLACVGGTIHCGDLCVQPSSDPANCGGCGVKCAPGLLCSAGVCALACDGADCGGKCADLAVDPANCGDCGNACAAGLVCSAGACALSCTGDLTECGSLCVATSNDPANCGACGVKCAAGYACASGACVLPCNGTDCGGQCVDTTVDPINCGACGATCKVGEICHAGGCVQSCAPGSQVCGGVCKDTALDPFNCGSCGAKCPPGLVCSEGACSLQCGGGSTKCGNACVNTAVDPSNCGACGAACPAGQVCSAGACAPCPPGKVLCQSACVDTSADAANCGACGNACPYVGYATSTCSGGVCTPKCDAGHGDCASGPVLCESWLSSDANNCGACGVVCPAGDYCTNGLCTACAAGTTWCGYGCVDTSTSFSNCGACNNFCPYGGPNTQSTCAGGICAAACYSGYVDCDGDPSNGCEVAVASDTHNCGTCGIGCAPSQVCSNGLCTSCPAGQTVCGNACVNLSSSTSNCGACGVACVSFAPHANALCSASTCALACATGYLDCDGNGLTGCEAALGPSNCGACGVTCSASQFCAKGSACTSCAPTDLGSAVPQTVNGTTVGKSDLFDSFCGFGNAPDIAYTFTAPAAGAYTFDTLGSSFNTVLEVRNGGCNGPRLGCNDNSGGALTSQLTVQLAANQVVLLLVDGTSGSQGSYALHVK